MVALDILGRRGALRVLWELRDAALTFRALQAASEMNPASLNKRIKELRELEIIDHSGDGYHLTKHGRLLMAAFEPLQAWADAWARQVDI
jgi:DNA-binding HxlR family transcriptional regulator